MLILFPLGFLLTSVSPLPVQAPYNIVDNVSIELEFIDVFVEPKIKITTEQVEGLSVASCEVICS